MMRFNGSSLTFFGVNQKWWMSLKAWQSAAPLQSLQEKLGYTAESIRDAFLERFADQWESHSFRVTQDEGTFTTALLEAFPGGDHSSETSKNKKQQALEFLLANMRFKIKGLLFRTSSTPIAAVAVAYCLESRTLWKLWEAVVAFVASNVEINSFTSILLLGI